MQQLRTLYCYFVTDTLVTAMFARPQCLYSVEREAQCVPGISFEEPHNVDNSPPVHVDQSMFTASAGKAVHCDRTSGIVQERANVVCSRKLPAERSSLFHFIRN